MGTLKKLPDDTFRTRQDRQRLLPRHHKIIDLALAGHDNKTIAMTLDIDPKTVGLVLRAPLTQAEMRRRREGSQESEILDLDRNAVLGKARSILEGASMCAANTVEALMDSDNENTQLKASLAILDRVFPKEAGPNNSGPVINVELNGEQANLLVIAMKESQDGRYNESATNGTSADPTEREHRDVEETPESHSLSSRPRETDSPNGTRNT